MFVYWRLLLTDLLGRLQLWSVATQIIKLSSLPAVSSLNQVSLLIALPTDWHKIEECLKPRATDP